MLPPSTMCFDLNSFQLYITEDSCQLCTKLLCTGLMKAYVDEMSCNQLLLIASATYTHQAQFARYRVCLMFNHYHVSLHCMRATCLKVRCDRSENLFSLSLHVARSCNRHFHLLLWQRILLGISLVIYKFIGFFRFCCHFLYYFALIEAGGARLQLTCDKANR